MSEGHFPLKYLGRHITHSKKKEKTLQRAYKEGEAKFQSSKGNILSYGGKEVLITSVLQSVLIHVLSAIVPPMCD